MAIKIDTRTSTPAHVLYVASEYQKLRESLPPSAGLYTGMLETDLGQFEYAYKPHLSYDGADHQECDVVLRKMLHEFEQYGNDDTMRLFTRLVLNVGRDHLLHGRSMGETYTDETGGTPCLAILPGWSLRSRRRKVEQVRASATGRDWIALRKENLVDFRLPDGLSKQLHRAHSRLRLLGHGRPGTPDLLASSGTSGYDFNAHRRGVDMLAARATSAIGWPGRGVFLDRATNSYQTFRELKFRLTCVKITLATLDILNDVCARYADATGVRFVVQIDGLPSLHRIEEAMGAVTTGIESLDDIFNNVLHPRQASIN